MKVLRANMRSPRHRQARAIAKPFLPDGGGALAPNTDTSTRLPIGVGWGPFKTQHHLTTAIGNEGTDHFFVPVSTEPYIIILGLGPFGVGTQQDTDNICSRSSEFQRNFIHNQ